MNVLITAPSLDFSQNVNGISTVVQAIIYHNDKHKYYHYLLGRPDKEQKKMFLIIQIIKQLTLFPVFLKKNKIMIVHQNLPFNQKGVLREFVINLWCLLFNVPVILHIHGGALLMNGTPNKFLLKLSEILLNNSKLVIVLSEIEKESLIINYNYHHAKVLNNSIDTSQYCKIRDFKNDKPTLLFLGRIHESKGVLDIITAFKLLRNDFEFKFILCGIGPLQDLFVTDCQKILGNDFEYLGIVSGADKLKVIGRSDYFLLPSRYGEGLPMALLETMSAGVVPVVTDDASMKFVVQHLDNGILVNKYDPQDLYEKMKIILSDATLYNSLSENAVKTVKDHFDIDNYIVQLNELYKLAIINKL